MAKMTEDPRIDALAQEFEKLDTACYGWTDAQFEIWWKRDDRNRNHMEQRAKAIAAIKLLDGWTND